MEKILLDSCKKQNWQNLPIYVSDEYKDYLLNNLFAIKILLNNEIATPSIALSEEFLYSKYLDEVKEFTLESENYFIKPFNNLDEIFIDSQVHKSSIYFYMIKEITEHPNPIWYFFCLRNKAFPNKTFTNMIMGNNGEIIISPFAKLLLPFNFYIKEEEVLDLLDDFQEKIMKPFFK